MKMSTLFCTALCVAATPAFANTSGRSDWYAGLSGDVTWLNHSRTGGGGNFQIGKQMWTTDSGAVRLEGEVGYHGVPNKTGYTGNTHYFTYMANGYYDFKPMTTVGGFQVSPYLGAGLGDATVKFGQRRGFTGGLGSTFVNFSSHDNVFAYQFMGGITLASAYMPNLDWTLGYGYLGSDKKDGQRLNANNIEIGARWHF